MSRKKTRNWINHSKGFKRPKLKVVEMKHWMTYSKLNKHLSKLKKKLVKWKKTSKGRDSSRMTWKRKSISLQWKKLNFNGTLRVSGMSLKMPETRQVRMVDPLGEQWMKWRRNDSGIWRRLSG
jgi:hypothetical protein